MLSGIVRLYFCFVNYLYFNSLSIVNSRYTFMFIFLFIYLTFCNKTEVKLLATTVKCRCVSSLPQHVVKQHASRTKKTTNQQNTFKTIIYLNLFRLSSLLLFCCCCCCCLCQNDFIITYNRILSIFFSMF